MDYGADRNAYTLFRGRRGRDHVRGCGQHPRQSGQRTPDDPPTIAAIPAIVLVIVLVAVVRRGQAARTTARSAGLPAATSTTTPKLARRLCQVVPNWRPMPH